MAVRELVRPREEKTLTPSWVPAAGFVSLETLGEGTRFIVITSFTDPSVLL